LEWHHTLVGAEVPNCCIWHCQMVLRLCYWIAQVTFNSETRTQSSPAVQMLSVITIKRFSHEIVQCYAVRQIFTYAAPNTWLESFMATAYNEVFFSDQLCRCRGGVQLQRLSLSPSSGLMCRSTLMMEPDIVSEASDINYTLTWPTAWQYIFFLQKIRKYLPDYTISLLQSPLWQPQISS
jgi:hypothetical protein